MGIQDSYTAYCLDTACAYIQIRLSDPESPEPQFQDSKPKKSYSSFSSFYQEMEAKL